MSPHTADRRRVVVAAALALLIVVGAVWLFASSGLTGIDVARAFRWQTAHGLLPPAWRVYFAWFLGAIVAAMILRGVPRAARVTTDDDGVRWKKGFSRGYATFESLETARVVASRGRAALELVGRSGAVMAVLDVTEPQRLLDEILHGIARLRTEPAHELARAGHPLETWLARLDGLRARIGVGYRAIDTAEGLTRTLANPKASVEERAAAAYVLGGTEAGRIRVDASLCATTPPLVTCLAHAGGVRVAADLLEEAESLLEPDTLEALAARRVR